MPNSNLLTRWLTALRASTRFATGRECDYAQSEGDADLFDPVGLLAYCDGDSPYGTGGWRTYPRTHTDDGGPEYAVNTGAYYCWRYAKDLATQVGLTLDDLHYLCLMADEGGQGWALANWVETRVMTRGQ